MASKPHPSLVVLPPLFRSRVHEAIRLLITRIDRVPSCIIGQHSEYIVEIHESGTGERTTVSKRYRNFLELHEALLQALGNHLAETPLPDPPPKRLFGNLDPDFTEERRSALELYLQSLLKLDTVSIAQPLWVFLDVDNVTLTVLRFLGHSIDESMVLHRLEGLRKLLSSSESDTSNGTIEKRIVQDLVIERLLKCLTLDYKPLVLRACLALTQMSIRYPKACPSLVRLNAIPALLNLLETFPLDSVLTSSTRECIFNLIHEHPPSLLVFFRTQNGMSQIHRMAKNASLSLFHSFLSLLLWLSIDQLEMQTAFADQESSGIDILGSLYRSPNASCRLFAGLVLSTVIIENKFHTSDVALQAARCVADLPEQLAGLSCRRERLKLKKPVPLKSKGLQGNPSRNSTPSDSSEDFLHNNNNNTAEETVIEVFEFQEFDFAIQRSMEKDYLQIFLSPTVDVHQQKQQQPTGAAEFPKRRPSTEAHNHTGQQEPQPAAFQELDLKELDYALLYVGTCSSPVLSQRVIHLLESCIPTGANAGSEEMRECKSSVSGFLLWVVNMLVSQSRHCHSRGILSCQGFVALHKMEQAEKLQRNEQSGNDESRKLEQHFNKEEGDELSVGDHTDVTERTTDTMCWNLQQAIVMGLASSASTLPPPIEASPVREKTIGDIDKGGGRAENLSPKNSHCPMDETQNLLSAPALPDLTSFFQTFSFKLKVHLNTTFTSHNFYILRSLATQRSRIPPWKRFPDTPRCLQTVEWMLVHGPTDIVRAYAASILLSIPWTEIASPEQISLSANRMPPSMPLRSNAISPRDAPVKCAPIRVLPLFKELFSTPFDQATVGVLCSPSTGDGSSVSHHHHHHHHQHQFVPTPQGVSRSSLLPSPSVAFIVPQHLLHQRMVTISTLLKLCESSTEEQRRHLKLEQAKLQKEEHQVNARQTGLPLDKSSLSNFAHELQAYLLVEEALKETTEMTKTFLAQTRSRLESQVLQRTGLTVSAAAVDTELVKLAAATEHLYEVYGEVSKRSVVLRQTRATADASLKSFADLSAELKRAHDAVKTAKRESQRKRERWMEMERAIAEAPEKRKRITEQLAQKELQEDEVAKKLAVVQKSLAEELASHNDAVAKNKESETAIHIIEATIADLERLILSSVAQEEQGHRPDSTEMETICSKLSEFIKERDAFKDLLKVSDVSRIQEFLRLEAEELHKNLFNPASSESLQRLEQLEDKLKRLMAQASKRAAEVKRLHAELLEQSDQRSLIDKSSGLQHDVRVSDTETQRLTTEVESLEEKVRLAEAELESRKTDVRAGEQDLFTYQELLSRLISDSNIERRSLFQKVLDIEKSLGEFLSEMTSAVEDSGYVVMNRGFLQHTLIKESKTRDAFRRKTKELIRVLENVDAALARIDSQIIGDAFIHVPSL